MDAKTQLLDILNTVLHEDVDENCSAENTETWDSLTHIEIIVTVEEVFGIKVPQEKIPELKSFKSLLAFIKNGVGTQS
jgi:acyl carrier protein